ncbi:MAG TPA: diacylglycerol kinase family protein [Gemmatimonadaceae bacterium]|nr:diacylglycerol kinase family protein [Gemmatimonadaceae bacterium]
MANPASGRGRGARLIPRVRAAFALVGISDLRETERAGDEARLVDAALSDGAETIAVLGGDGTWSKCAAALASSRAHATMAFLQAGTGNDFARNFPAPSHDVHAMARLVAHGGVEQRVDMGRVESAGRTDWFLNVVGFGFDVAVLQQLAQGCALRGRATYLAAALGQLLSYQGVDLTPDAHESARRRVMMLVISNGRTFGGAFRIAPAANVTDGLLDLIEIGDVRGAARLPLLLRVLRGAHLAHPRVTARRADRFEWCFAEAPAYEVDGELCQAGSREVHVMCVGSAIRVLAASPEAGVAVAAEPARSK